VTHDDKSQPTERLDNSSVAAFGAYSVVEGRGLLLGVQQPEDSQAVK